MKKNVYKVGIVGLGGMGYWHFDQIDELECVEVSGIYDVDEQIMSDAREAGVHTFDSVDEMVESSDVDIVLIATPNHFHKDIAVKAMDNGKNVISEKPVTLNSEMLQQMIDASERNGVIFTVHQNRRWDEDFLTIKKIYDNHLLGDVYCVESRVHGSRGIPGDWRGTKEAGGGMVFDWGVHIIDQILLLIPEKVTKIYAEKTNITNKEVDDGFKILATFESGKKAHLEVGTHNFIELPRWYMLGVDGTAVIDNWNLDGKIMHITDRTQNDAKPIVTAAGLTKTMAPRTKATVVESALPIVKSDVGDFYRNVTKTIAGKENQLITHAQLMRVMKFIEAVFESFETGEVVYFE